MSMVKHDNVWRLPDELEVTASAAKEAASKGGAKSACSGSASDARDFLLRTGTQ